MSNTVHVDTFEQLLKKAKEAPETIKPHEVAMLAAYAESHIAQLECQVLIARHADPSDKAVTYVPVPMQHDRAWWDMQPTCGTDLGKVPVTTCYMGDG
jgi:hypothetical protein